MQPPFTLCKGAAHDQTGRHRQFPLYVKKCDPATVIIPVERAMPEDAKDAVRQSGIVSKFMDNPDSVSLIFTQFVDKGGPNIGSVLPVVHTIRELLP